MTRRLAFITLVGLAGLAGCPSDQFDYKTWTNKLDDSRESERAVQKLEELGNPGAIPALGEAWADQGKPARFLQVIIALARPMTPEEVKDNCSTEPNAARSKGTCIPEYEKTGRKASWDAALPYLKKALLEVDENNPRSVDSASKAADALGDAKLAAGLEALVEFAHRATSKKIANAQVATIKAIGKYDNEKPAATAALVKLIDREPPPHPDTVGKENKSAANEKYELFLAITGSAINALSELRTPQAAKTLVIAQYRTPALFGQIRRALVASGPDAKAELRRIITDQHPEVEQLFKQEKYAKYCSPKTAGTERQCFPVSAKYFYPSTVLGDFYDPATVTDLLKVLGKDPLPAYYVPGDADAEDRAGPTQHAAVFDALGKIGGAEAAKPIYELWKTVKSPGTSEAPSPLFPSQTMAIVKYPFLARDLTGVRQLADFAADNGKGKDPQYHDQLRTVSAEAFARLSRDPGDIKILQDLAKKYFDASAEKRKLADGKPKVDKEKADKELEKEKKKVEELKIELLKLTKDQSKTADDINKATKKVKDAELALKGHKLKHRQAVQPFKELDGAAKDYKSFARVFQYHIARIQTGIRCKDNLDCYADTLKMKPDEAKGFVKNYIPDLASWTKDEVQRLLEGTIERAMLEIGKKGQAANKYTDLLLDHAKTDNRIIRQSVLLALPKIAKIPCNTCEAKLDDALRAGEGKNMLKDLQVETTMMRNYFSWAGGKTPSKSQQAEAPLPDTTPEPVKKKEDPKEEDDEPAPAKGAPAKGAPAKGAPAKKGK